MLDTGMRLSEVANLKESDVHLEERYVKALGKGSKERIVAFGAACQRAPVSAPYSITIIIFASYPPTPTWTRSSGRRPP